MRILLRLVGLALLAVLFAGCSATSANISTPATHTPAATATTAPATPTSTPLPTNTTFTCPATINGSSKVFTDSATSLSFSYPAAWTEADCQRIVGANGEQTLIIGNVFLVSVTPRNGLTIQQWVNQQTDTNETVTLAPLSVSHAQAAVSVTVGLGPNAGPNEPFLQALAIVAGSQSFYQVNGLIAQMSVTDTMPGESNTNLVQQVVTTFDVS